MAKQKKLPEGYEIPLHRSLSMPMLWMGIPRPLFFLAIFFGIFAVMIFKSMAMLIISFFMYLLFRWLARYDKQFHRVFLANRYYKKYYYP